MALLERTVAKICVWLTEATGTINTILKGYIKSLKSRRKCQVQWKARSQIEDRQVLQGHWWAIKGVMHQWIPQENLWSHPTTMKRKKLIESNVLRKLNKISNGKFGVLKPRLFKYVNGSDKYSEWREQNKKFLDNSADLAASVAPKSWSTFQVEILHQDTQT